MVVTLFACSATTQLTQFNKQKYTKKFHAKKVKYEDKINSYADNNQSINEIERKKLDVAEASRTAQFKNLYKPTFVKLADNKIRNTIEIKSKTNKFNISDNRVTTSHNVNNISSIDKEFINIKANTTTKKSSSFSVNLLLIIIAILLPPLAVLLYEGATSRFWIDLLLTLLFYIPGLIYALIIILE